MTRGEMLSGIGDCEPDAASLYYLPIMFPPHIMPPPK